MSRYMRFIEQVLSTETIDIFAWPTFLPVPIARLYQQLWTRQRIESIVDLARARKIATEVNEWRTSLTRTSFSWRNEGAEAWGLKLWD